MTAFLNTGCTNRSTFANVSILSPENETRMINKLHCETQWFNLDGSIANRYRGCPERSHFPSTTQSTSFGQGCATNEFNLIQDAPNNNWSTADHQCCCGFQVHNSDAFEEDETNRYEEDKRNAKFLDPLHGFHMCSTPSFHDGADKHQELDYSMLASIPSTGFSESPIVPASAKNSRTNCSTKIYHFLSLEHLSQTETPHTHVITESKPFQIDRCRIYKNKANAARFPQGIRKFELPLQEHLAKSRLTAGCTYYRHNQLVWHDEKVNVASGLDETFVAAGEDLTTTKQWFRIIMVILICITVILCFGLRLNDWYRRYKLMQKYFVYVTKDPGDSDKDLFGEEQWPEDTDAVRDAGHLVDPVEKISSVASSKGMVLTLCNLNPIRGTSLFAVQNGSSIYDWILENQNNKLNGKEIRKPVTRTRTLVSLDLLRRTGLRIEEMLKFCRSDKYIYESGNFSTILTHYGLCYLVEVEADVRNIHCILDPQEYDYLIYGYNAVGFRIWLHFTKKQAIADLQIDQHSTYVDLHAADAQIKGIRPNEVIVGSNFDTVIRVVGNLKHRAKCQAITYPSCGLSCLGPENDVNEQDNAFKNKGTFKWQPENWHSGKIPNLPGTSCLPYVLSALQLPKSSEYHKLLALKRPTMFQRNALAVSMGLRIQQRAYLRLANATAFEGLRALLDAFGDLQNGLENISTQVYTIRGRLWSDEVKFSQVLAQYVNICVKANIG
ncbi:unnamed protein product [Dicrocoelium dendriticum]|nr:unnamed protein product [Dicrocoelium dendriticum]